mgnify:CR=1 FL=1
MPWDYIVVLVVSIILQIALAPKAAVPQAATLDDFDFPQADEGTPICVVFGDVWIEGWTVLSYGDLRTTEIEA